MRAARFGLQSQITCWSQVAIDDAVFAGLVEKTHAEYVAELEEKNPTVVAIDEYISANKKIRHQCKKGHKPWLAKPESILRGHGCARCKFEEKTKTSDEYEAELSNMATGVKALENYSGSHKKIMHQCLKGHKWLVSPNHVLKGVGCPKCQHQGSAANVFYIWENTQDPGVYKVGITSDRCADERIAICTRKNDMTANVILMAHTPNARDIERRALELGDDPRYPDTIDGYTEFRRYSDAELGEVWRMAVGA